MQQTHWLRKAGHATTRRRVLVRWSHSTPPAIVVLPTADHLPPHWPPFNFLPTRQSVRGHPQPLWASAYSCAVLDTLPHQKRHPLYECPYKGRNVRVPKRKVRPEVEVALEGIAPQQAHQRPAEHSSHSPANCFHPRHCVCAPSAVDIAPCDVLIGRPCSLSALMR